MLLVHAPAPHEPRTQTRWVGLTLTEELSQIQQLHLLYPPQGEKEPPCVATVLSKQTLTQQALADALGLNQLRIPLIG